MSWIKVINEKYATGELKEIYDEIIRKRGKLSNIMRIHSLNPGAMKMHMDLYVHLMFGKSPLSRAEREMIGVVVSAANHCNYCIRHHAEALNFYWKNISRIKNLIHDPSTADLSEREHLIVRYAQMLTRNPSDISEEFIQELKNVGLDDRAILDINLITAYFNFVNRIVLGLGVSFSEDEIKGYKY